MTMFLNGTTQVTTVRLFVPWTGVWSAEVDLDADSVPSGRVPLTIGETLLSGTVDPSGSGVFGLQARARILGGGAGWSKSVAAQQWHNDGGVLSTTVLQATATAVGETVVDTEPTRLGPDYERVATEPASQVLAGRDWYVDLTGTTIIGARPTFPAPPTIEILSWDPVERRAELAADEVILPGTILTDDRFGSAIVRDVEQVFDASGARATAWCGPTPESRVIAAVRNLVQATSGVMWLKTYRYRVVSQAADGRVTLQSVVKSSGVPDSILLPIWYGAPGVTAKVAPSSEVLVEFGGDRTTPRVRGFAGDAPLELTFDASTFINIGDGASDFVALASLVLAELQAIKTAFDAHTHVSAAPTVATSTPTPTLPAPGSVAATKARAL